MQRSLYTSIFLLAGLLAEAGPWLQKSSLPGPGRHRGYSFVVGNKAYVGGGWNGMVMYNDCWEYDPSTNSWTQRANVPLTSAYTCTGGGIGNKGYICGGTLNTLLLEYNPATNAWLQKAPCPAPIFWESSTIIFNNKLHIPASGIMYIYDPAVNTWQSLSTSNSVSWYGPSATVNNFAYSVFVSSSQTWRFDFATNTWTQMALFPGEARTQAVAFAANGKIYGGTGDGVVNDNVNDFWEYDPALNSWLRVDDMPAATRENSTAFTLEGRGYVCTGTNGTNMQDLWMFIPEQITGIEEDENFSVSVFPNPVTTHFCVQSGSTVSDGTYIELFQADGKRVLVRELTSASNSISRGDLPAGMYYYSIRNKEKYLHSGKLLFQ